GAYIGSDLCRGKQAGHADLDFCYNVLRCRWDAGHAASRGRLESVDSLFLPLYSTWEFAQAGSDSLYGAEAPDALSACEGSRTVLRYEENQFSAAVAYKDRCGVFVCGFPFETIYPAFRRDQFMQAILRLLTP
ncbi:xanthan lyase, partial [bacterium]|nr:xanthan lyase [bacterium]